MTFKDDIREKCSDWNFGDPIRSCKECGIELGDYSQCVECGACYCEYHKDKLEYDEYADNYICIGDCLEKYNETRIWEFKTKHDESIIIDPNDSINNEKMFAIEMVNGFFSPDELDNFLRLLIKVRGIQKRKNKL